MKWSKKQLADQKIKMSRLKMKARGFSEMDKERDNLQVSKTEIEE